MENWQFLIQKQGDRSWHSLESPKVEIIEGMYRIVTRSDLSNVNVEVRVIYSSTLEIPPKRRIQKRSRRTTSEGLMVVIPYTYLKPGFWEMQCSGDLVLDNVRKSWQYNLCLVVLPNLSLSQTNTLEPAGSIPSNLLLNPVTESDNQVVIDEPITPVWLKADTAEEILKNLVSLALPPGEALPEDEISIEDSAPVIALPLLLTLEQETYIASWGEILTINGHVEPEKITYVVNGAQNCETVYNGELKIQLCSPDTSETLAKEQRLLPDKSLPFSIKVPIQIPSDCKSKLILADITLYGSFFRAGEVRTLANQSFTITANVAQLLAMNTATTNSEPDIIENPALTKAPKQSAPLNLELFNLVKTVKKPEPLLVKESPSKFFPPQIATRQLDKTGASPQLPQLPKNKIYKVGVPVISPANARTSISTTFRYLRRVQVQPVDPPHQTLELQYTNTIKADDKNLSYQNDSFVEKIIPSSHESVDVGDSYLSPLIKKWVQSQGYSPYQTVEDDEDKHQTLIVSSKNSAEKQLEQLSLNEVSSQQELQQPAPTDMITSLTDLIEELSLSFIDQPSITSTTTLLADAFCVNNLNQPSAALAREIVVYDAYTEAEVDAFEQHTSKVEQKSVLDLPPVREPLAIPELHLPEGELIAGKSVRVIVRLPNKRPQVSVKLWIEDCQTRRLLDGPRLLKNLLPKYDGKLEVITHITVPLGCLEIRLEAIALDTLTKQESHKVSIHRTVIPPDLQHLPVDEMFLRR